MLAKKSAASILSAAALLAGCSGTGGTLGDGPQKPLASEYGNGSQLSELVTPAPWVNAKNQTSVGCAYPAESNIYVTGVTINAIDSFDETNSGSVGTYYVQDSTSQSPYSGVDVFSPSFSPPDLRLAAGDVTDILGVYEEFPGPSTFIFPDCKTLPEVSGTMSFRFENGSTPPKTIPLTDLSTYAGARQWLGMLVRIENVSLYAGGSDSKGRYTALFAEMGTMSDIPAVSNELFDVPGELPAISAGTTSFKSITGIVTFFASFHIAPRSAADFEQ